MPNIHRLQIHFHDKQQGIALTYHDKNDAEKNAEILQREMQEKRDTAAIYNDDIGNSLVVRGVDIQYLLLTDLERDLGAMVDIQTMTATAQAKASARAEAAVASMPKLIQRGH